MKLMKFKSITGVLHCKTGLRIGGTKEGVLEPGASENTVIKHPVTSLPYIPGSSLKGKVRSLLEQASAISGAHIGPDGKPCKCGKCFVCKVFGSHDTHNKEITRIIFRDCDLTPESEEKLREIQEEKGLNFTEVKSENIINRRTGVAADKGLRTQERVPSGSEFKMAIVLKVFEGDDEAGMMSLIENGLDLLQKDYLGSSGSRGYGQVEIRDLKVDDIPVG